MEDAMKFDRLLNDALEDINDDDHVGGNINTPLRDDAFEQSPYKNTAIHSDRSGYSLGFGIRFGNGSLDLAYTQQKKDFQQQFYSIGLTDTAAVAQQSGTVAVTYNVRF